MTDNTTQPEVTLLPCPFCGGAVSINPAKCAGEYPFIYHEPKVGGHHCGMEGFSGFNTGADDEQSLVALWNTRLSQPPTASTSDVREGLTSVETAISRAMNHEYNPFEPDNQTEAYRRLEAALAALSAQPAPVMVELSRYESHIALWKAIEAITLGNKTDDKLILENLRDQGVWLHRFKGCVNHPERAIREHLDGDDLCQECCDQWARNEGRASNEVAPADGEGA